jgi:hypothetical protein
MDIYKCERCNEIFDEFEMNYKQAQIDKQCLCDECRKITREEQMEFEAEMSKNLYI